MKIWTISEAQAEMLKRLEAKEVVGGAYVRDDGTRCAIGWLMTKEHAERAETGMDIYPYPLTLMRENLLKFQESDTTKIAEWLRQIQRHVDLRQWATAERMIKDGPL